LFFDFNRSIDVFIFNINIFDAANSFYLKKYTNIHITLAAFEQTLLMLKIYSTRTCIKVRMNRRR